MPGLANGMGAAGKHLGFAGGQTAGLNHHKRTMPGLANGMGAAGKHLGGFAGGQTAGLNHHKRTMPGLANGMGHGSCREAFGEFCGLANGRLEPP